MSQEQGLHDFSPSLLLAVLKQRWKVLLAGMVLVGGLTFLALLFVPSYYRSDDVMGVELKSSFVAEGLHAVGNAMGYHLGAVREHSDAFFYDQFIFLLRSPDFLKGVMQVEVTLADGRKQTYYEYLASQRPAWIRLRDWFTGKTDGTSDLGQIDPYRLTFHQSEIFDEAARRIHCVADTKKAIFSVFVMDRDPVVCATLADSVKARIQHFIAGYRVEKYAEGAAHLQRLVNQAEGRYHAAADAYNRYASAHVGQASPSVEIHRNALEQEMSQRQDIAEAVRAQYFQARSLVQDQTPVFFPLERAAVSPEPEGPQRLQTALLATFLAMTVMILFYLRGVILGHLFGWRL